MFGYVRLFKPTITMGEYEQYKMSVNNFRPSEETVIS